ncbi:TetR/AcrR family transcriptional regulator [Nocardia sp. CA-128927]|uniref:TetR/AcrR family transcriptional regulator n=1 Tax=Nocardia sp. CA-128927 TaxID=3239975 RepID=UPI003D974E91
MADPKVPEAIAVEGVRARKKRLMRRQLSDTATAMFLARGFDAVKVSEVAAACGVSEKTVFNYFPSKEALILDRLEPAVDSICDSLAAAQNAPVATFSELLERETRGITASLSAGNAQDAARIRRFGVLLRNTPALRAYQSEMMGHVAAAIAATLATRAGLTADDPEPQIAAHALLSLWRVQADSLHRHLTENPRPELVYDAVIADVRRAARLLEIGLGAWVPDERTLL